MTERALRSELTTVYMDPVTTSLNILAYVPELHAWQSCGRALPKGIKEHAPAPGDAWCDACTCATPAEATVRLGDDGQWEKV